MKKFITWTFVITIFVFLVDWGVMGVKIFDNNYDIVMEAYIGLICILIFLVSAIYKIFNNKCPHCGKLRLTSGEYCSYCGKKI